MAIDYVALRNEIQNDPTGIGYAALVTLGADADIAAALNLVRQTISVSVNSLTMAKIFEAIDATEFSALSAANLQRLAIILQQGGSVDVKGSNVRAMLGGIFPGGGPTRTALLAAVSRKGSRAEQLWGSGVSISATDVAVALRGA